MVTIMNSQGKPVQIPAAALQAANTQNQIGMLGFKLIKSVI